MKIIQLDKRQGVAFKWVVAHQLEALNRPGRTCEKHQIILRKCLGLSQSFISVTRRDVTRYLRLYSMAELVSKRCFLSLPSGDVR